jgi:protease stability complex PrcB-like protein
MAVLMACLIALLQTGTPPRTLDRGDQSNVDSEKQVVVRTAAEWKTVWQQHSPDRPLPALDFRKEMAVGVFLGSRNTAGYSVDIISVQPDHGALVVRYRQRSPAGDAIVAQVITSPYHIVAVPRAAGDVKFEKVP